jgi:hypothetical protein
MALHFAITRRIGNTEITGGIRGQSAVSARSCWSLKTLLSSTGDNGPSQGLAQSCGRRVRVHRRTKRRWQKHNTKSNFRHGKMQAGTTYLLPRQRNYRNAGTQAHGTWDHPCPGGPAHISLPYCDGESRNLRLSC